MGFIIQTYKLYGLPPLPNIYVTCKGSYRVQKDPVTNFYNIYFTCFFQASQNDPVITQREMNFSIQVLPNNPILFNII